MNPGRTDAAYIAGPVDGESTVTPSRRHGSENRRLVVGICYLLWPCENV